MDFEFQIAIFQSGVGDGCQRAASLSLVKIVGTVRHLQSSQGQKCWLFMKCCVKNGVCEMCRVDQQHARDDRDQWKTVIHNLPLSPMGGTNEAAAMVRVRSINIDHKNAKVPSLVGFRTR
jgi:hypothetical protein